MNKKFNIAFLISDDGDNMNATLESINYGYNPIKVSCIISDNQNAYGLTRARGANIPCIALNKDSFSTDEEYDLALHKFLMEHNVKLICIDGFEHKLGKKFINNWFNAIISVHSSLLPSFKGIDPVKQAIKEGVKITGCSVFFVRHKINYGPIIIQAAAPIFSDDDEEMVKRRVLEIEQKCYPVAIRLIAENKIFFDKNTVSITY